MRQGEESKTCFPIMSSYTIKRRVYVFVCLFVCLFFMYDNKLTKRNRNRNRKLKTSKALLKSQAHQGTSLFTSAATNQRGVSKGGQEKLSSQFQNTRKPHRNS